MNSTTNITNININISDTAIKWIVSGACFLGAAYLFYKLVENRADCDIPLPKEAKQFSDLPELSPKEFEDLNFHPEVKNKASQSFKAGDYVSSVRHAVVCLFDIIRRKSGVDGDATSLVQKVFRGKIPVLKFQDNAPSHVTNTDSGLIDMLEGFAKSIRKIQMHATIEISKETALREISIACYLAEQVDQYAVINKTTINVEVA